MAALYGLLWRKLTLSLSVPGRPSTIMNEPNLELTHYFCRAADLRFKTMVQGKLTKVLLWFRHIFLILVGLLSWIGISELLWLKSWTSIFPAACQCSFRNRRRKCWLNSPPTTQLIFTDMSLFSWLSLQSAGQRSKDIVVGERETKWANLSIQVTAILSLTYLRVHFTPHTKT